MGATSGARLRSVPVARRLAAGSFVLALAISGITCHVDKLLQPSTLDLRLTVAADTVGIADSVRLVAVVTADGKPSNAVRVVWITSDTSIARVDSTGLTRGRARGTATITARIENAVFLPAPLTASAAVQVVVPRVTVTPDSTTLTSVGDTLCLGAVPLDAAGNTVVGVTVAFAKDTDPDTTLTQGATPDCYIARKSGAPARIRAFVDIGADTATVSVQQVADTLSIAPDSVRFYTLTRQQSLPVTVLDERRNPIPAPSITWTSANDSVATVTTTGTVTAQRNGTTFVRAQSGAVIDSVKIIVQQVANDIAVTPADDTLRTVRGRRTLRATVRDSLAQPIPGAAPAWTSLASDSVAVVFQNGDSARVEAVAEGAATITAQQSVSGDVITGTARIAVRYQLVSLTVTPAAPTLDAVGDTVRFSATGRDVNDSVVPQPRAVWRSADTTRLRIDSLTGLATARDSGSSNVIARRDAVADTATASVTPPVLDVVTTAFTDSALRSSVDSPSVTRTVGNGGTGVLGAKLTILHSAPWLAVSPDTVTIPAGNSTSIRLTATAGSLVEGTYVDTVRITSVGAARSPRDIPVTFRVYCPLTLVGPDTALAAALAATDCGARHQAGSFADYYRFSGVAGDTLRIALSTSPTSRDTYLYLLDAAGTVIASNDNCPGSGLNSCLQLVVPANGQYTIEATSFNPSAAFSYTLGLTQPVAPAAPTALVQLANDTVLAVGDSANTSTIEFRVTAQDQNPRDTLRLQVEVRPLSQAFDETVTVTGSSVPNAGGGVALSAQVSALANFTDYHWQARVIDQTGRAGPWTAFDPAPGADFTVAITTPVLTVTPSAIHDTAAFGATGVDTFLVRVLNTGTGTFTWSASESSPWITFSATGSNPGDTLRILLDPSGLAAGTYTDTVTVTAAGAVGSPAKVPVTFVIEQPVLVVNRDSVTRSTNFGSGASFADTLGIFNGGNGSLSWSATHNVANTWLSFAPTSGSAPDSIPLTINSSGLAAGTYRDTIVVDAGTATGSPHSVPVTLNVHQPTLVVAPTTIQDSANAGSTTDRTHVLHVSNGDGGTMTWNATKTAAWVTLERAGDSVVVTLEPDTLSGVLHQDTITFTSPEANNDPVKVPVDFDILQPILAVAPGSIVDSAVQLSGASRVHKLGVMNTGRGVLTWTAVRDNPWITLAADTVLDTLTVTLNSSGLVVGTHTGKVIVTAPNATESPDTIPVTFNITPPPVLSISPASYADSAFKGSLQAKSVVLHVSNTGPGTFSWSAVRDSSWLSLAGTSGAPGDSIIVTLTPGTLANGTHPGTVTVTAPGAAGSPATIPITFKIKPCAEPAVIPDAVVSASVTLSDCGAPLRAGSVAKLYSVNATANDTLSFRLTAVFDAYLALSDSFGVSLRQDDECAPEVGTACIKDYPVTVTGRYVIEATTATAGDTGAFSLLAVRERAPNAPQSIGQFEGDSATSVGTGSNTPENVAVFEGTITDPNVSDSVRLEVELALAGSPFSSSPTDQSAFVAVAGGPKTVAIRVSTLAENQGYRWQARTCDRTSRCSAWLDFGSNGTAADFSVNAILETPAAPTDTGQFMANGTTPIPLGGVAGSTSATVVLKGLVTDPDPGDLISLEVEVKETTTTGPDGTGLVRGTGVATNLKASVTITRPGAILLGTNYYWRARACDQTNRCSGWVNFGSNVNTSGGALNPADTDFRVNP